MSTALNAAGVAYAKALVAAGKVNSGTWDFTADDGNKLLGASGDDWANYGKWFLATHPDQPANTKAHYGYPFGKGDEVYHNAVMSAKGRAAQQGATAVENACSALLDAMMPPKKDAGMIKAWSAFEIKSIDEEQWTFEGIATTPSTDRMDDIVDPMGAVYAKTIPMMWQHGKGSIKDPVGWVTPSHPTAKGIPVRGQVAKPKADYPQVLRDELTGVWVKIRDGIVRGLSIGFRSLEDEPIKGSNFGTRFLKWEWLELSAVGIPANADASITSIKSYDEQGLSAASGAITDSAYRLGLKSTPGVAGTRKSKGAGMKTYKEQIQEAQNKRAANVARMEELMSKADGGTLNEAEGQEFDDLEKENEQVDKHLTRLKGLEKTVAEKAQPIIADAAGNDTVRTPAASGGGNGSGNGYVSWKKSTPAPGIAFARYAQCVAASKGNMMQAEQLARKHFPDSGLDNVFRIATTGNLGEMMMHAKTAVTAGTTQDATWAAPLVQQVMDAAEFVEFLRPMTLLGRIPGIRRVPFNIKFPRQTSGTNGTFVGEGLPKPLGKLDFELLSLTWAKAATIVVFSDEIARFSDPSIETLVRDDLAAGIAQYLDKRFIDPVYAGVANVSPASITNGVTPIVSGGTSVTNIEDAAKAAFDAMAASNIPGPYVWLMSPAVAISLSLKRAATLEMRAFPTITAEGGTFLGYPVVVSNNVGLSGSPTESFVVLMAPNEVMLADDGGVTIDMSTEASLQMDSAPSNPVTSSVSLWQSNLIGLRAERYINWRLRHTGAVQVITMNQLW